MVTRKHIEVAEGHAAEFEIDGEIFTISNCRFFAEAENKPAGIIDAVLRTMDDRFLRVTTVAERVVAGHAETRQGWYVASFLDAYEAHLLREAWTVLMEQPSQREPSRLEDL